jgi:hypothetical protein
MTTIKYRGASWAVLASAVLLAGCGEEDDPISKLDSLRIVAVRADQSFATPASTVQLEMLVRDAAPTARDDQGVARDVSLLWLGSCVNPPGDLYYNCLPTLHESLREVTDTELSAAEPTAATAAARLGFGPSYALTLARDIITSRPPSDNLVYSYGVTFVFYAACAGELRIVRDADPENDYPIGCYDRETGKALGQSDFEFGFYPVYAYDELTNGNPEIVEVEFDAEPSAAVCETDADCSKTEACGSSNRCITRVDSCASEKSCKKYDLFPRVELASVEKAASAHIGEAEAPRETLWVSYYADYGVFKKASRSIYEAASGMRDDYEGVWMPLRDDDAPSLPREARLFAVVRDSRGGVNWVTRDVYVE